MVNSNPIVGMILSEISPQDKAAVREVLDGMIRERAGGSGTAVLTAGLNMAVGRK